MENSNGLEKAKRWVDLIAGVSVILTMGFIALQWSEMRSGSVDTHDLAVAAKAQADAVKSQADNTKIIAEAAKSQAEDTRNLALAAADQVTKLAAGVRESHLLAKAAMGATDIAQKQFEMNERPWVDANIVLDGPFDFNVNGANIHLKLALRNSGHSPAQSTTISYLPLIGSTGTNAANYREQVCRDASRIATTMSFGVTLFPNVNFEQRESIGIGKEEIEKRKASKEFPGSTFPNAILSPSLVICIAYRPTFKSTSVYHTAYIIDLYKLDSANLPGMMFKIGEDVDQGHLFLRMHVVDAISAD
jgi:hypothetical protein